MQDEHPESFDLPDWGTEGAPPEPATDVADEREAPPGGVDVHLEVESEVVQSTTDLPSSYRIRSVIGLVSAEGTASVANGTTLQSATGAARSAALDRLTSEAETIGATAVAGIRLSVAVRLNDVVVVAYGTALDAVRA